MFACVAVVVVAVVVAAVIVGVVFLKYLIDVAVRVEAVHFRLVQTSGGMPSAMWITPLTTETEVSEPTSSK